MEDQIPFMPHSLNTFKRSESRTVLESEAMSDTESALSTFDESLASLTISSRTTSSEPPSPTTSVTSSSTNKSPRLPNQGIKRANNGEEKGNVKDEIDLTDEKEDEDIIFISYKKPKLVIDLTECKEEKDCKITVKSDRCSVSMQTDNEATPSQAVTSETSSSEVSSSEATPSDATTSQATTSETSSSEASSSEASSSEASSNEASSSEASSSEASSSEASSSEASSSEASSSEASSSEASSSEVITSEPPSREATSNTQVQCSQATNGQQNSIQVCSSVMISPSTSDDHANELYESLELSLEPEVLPLAVIPRSFYLAPELNLSEIIQRGLKLMKGYLHQAQPCVGTIINCTEENEFEKLVLQSLSEEAKDLLLRCVNGYKPGELKQPIKDPEAVTKVHLLIFKKEGQLRSGYIRICKDKVHQVAGKTKDYSKDCKEYYVRGPYGFGKVELESVCCIPLWRRDPNWNVQYCQKMYNKESKSFNDEQMVRNSFTQVVKCLLVLLCWTNQNDVRLNENIRKFFPRSRPPFVGLNYHFSIDQTYNKLQDK